MRLHYPYNFQYQHSVYVVALGKICQQTKCKETPPPPSKKERKENKQTKAKIDVKKKINIIRMAILRLRN